MGIHSIAHLVTTAQRGGGGPHIVRVLGGYSAEHRIPIVEGGGDVCYESHTVRIEDYRKRYRFHRSCCLGGAACGSGMPACVQIVAVGDGATIAADAALCPRQQGSDIVAVFNGVSRISADAAGVIFGGDVTHIVAVDNGIRGSTDAAGVASTGFGCRDVTEVIAFGDRVTIPADAAGIGIGTKVRGR